jgi:glutamyl-tRNA reductase
VTSAVWLSAAVAAADRYPVDERDAIARTLAARAPDPGRATIVTCHRVEAYVVDPTATRTTGDRLADDDAVRHLVRLAVGLESAVLGEDQVLHQVRLALADLRDRRADARLIRIFELAVAAGRRARALHPAADRNLADVGVRWLERRCGPLEGATVVVAGAGTMGRAATAAFVRRGARVVIASRSAGRAEALAARAHGRGTDLETAASDARGAQGVVVALAGQWKAFGGETRGAVVDLSFPLAVTASARRTLGDRFADVDRIYREAGTLRSDGGTDAAGADYRATAEAIVEETVAAASAWIHGRQSVATLRALRDRSEEQRAAEFQRVLRRLPDLDDRERDVLEAFSQRLVAGFLHRPSAALRDDLDGSAAAAAARLFDL